MNWPFTFRQLEIYSRLCATRSFRRTAEALGVSQASVSSQIKALETQLGVALFHRQSGRRPALTAEGMAFEEDLKNFRHSADKLARHRRRSIQEMQQPTRYRVFVGQGLMDNFIRKGLGSFLCAHPMIELTFEARPPGQSIVGELETAQFDFALIHRRTDLPVDPYFRPLALVKGGVYGSPKFAQGRTLPLSLDILNSLPFIFPHAGGGPDRDIVSFYERYGIRPQKIVSYAQYYEVMADMLKNGVGVASFADPLIPPGMKDIIVQLRPLENWRLLWYRKDQENDARCDIIQSFLWSSVIGDPNYRMIECYVEKSELAPLPEAG